jgi:hypothetical protein
VFPEELDACTRDGCPLASRSCALSRSVSARDHTGILRRYNEPRACWATSGDATQQRTSARKDRDIGLWSWVTMNVGARRVGVNGGGDELGFRPAVPSPNAMGGAGRGRGTRQSSPRRFRSVY